MVSENEQVLESIAEKRTLGHVLRRNFLLRDAIEGQMTDMQGVRRRGTQLLD